MSYEPPGGEWSKTQLRELFLVSVNDLAPHVLIEWGSEPYKLFLEAGMYGHNPLPWSGLDGMRLYRWLASELLKSESRVWRRLEHSEPVRSFCDALLEWAAKYNLSAKWVLERAMWTLFRWQQKGRQPGFTEERGWALTGVGGTVPNTLPPGAIFIDVYCLDGILLYS